MFVDDRPHGEFSFEQQLGLVDDDAIRRHKQSSYSQEWFEINPGDRIAIRVGEDEIEDRKN